MLAIVFLAASVLVVPLLGQRTPRPFQPDDYRYRHIFAKTPFVFNELGSFNDSIEWWTEFNTKLLIKQCPSFIARTGCLKYGHDSYFNDIFDYLYTACVHHFENPTDLKAKTEAYCEYRIQDDAVVKAFEKTTGCRLADHLNQVCRDRNVSNAGYCGAPGASPGCIGMCPAVEDMNGTMGLLPSCTGTDYFFVCVGTSTATRLEARCAFGEIFNATSMACETCAAPVPPMPGQMMMPMMPGGMMMPMMMPAQ